MTAARKGLYKAEYEGQQAGGRLTPGEAPRYEAARDRLMRRLTEAMLVLASLEDEGGGKTSSWPSYIHDLADRAGQGEYEFGADTRPARFDPTPGQLSDFLPTMGLLDGLRPLFLRVLYLRAIGSYYGGWSFEAIGDRYGKTGQWAKEAYEAVVIQAARRCGVLPEAPEGWAVLVASVDYVGWRTFLTTAGDPAQQLRDLRAKSPIRISEAFALWTPGQPAAKRLAKAARKHLMGRVTHGSWHLVSADDMASLLIGEARAQQIAWIQESLPVPADGSGPHAALLRASLRDGMGDSQDAAETACDAHD